ncbi:NDR1/HIN1-like protein 1 [Momordica charantia]|uniref:NDR1/HIN1-like protein 1 n=1 Tax=Momordica charantia TaxID=3673 RepID=A0A6J1CLY1_MOMCH|nr:NDR1/HIN1-like protein 1 [Momordica charantia]
MTVKDCDHHHHHCDRHRLYRRIACAIFTVVLLVGVVIFLIWAILRPSKPRLILQDVTVFALNVSAVPPITISATMQITVSSRNPNSRIGVYYQKMDVYAAYRGQQVTLPTVLPPTYQGHNDVVVWSPFLYGDAVPVSPEFAGALSEDNNVGAMLFSIKVNGQVRWKVGSWISGRYRLNANCPAYIRFGDPKQGIAFGPAMKFQFVQACYVDI